MFNIRLLAYFCELWFQWKFEFQSVCGVILVCLIYPVLLGLALVCWCCLSGWNFLWLGCQISLGEGGVYRNPSIGIPQLLRFLWARVASQFHGDKVASGTRLPRTELLTVTGLFLIPPVSYSVSAQGKKSLQAWGTKGLHQLGHLLSLGFSSWFLLHTLVSFHGKEDSLAQQRRMVSPFLAGLLVGPPCMRLSEGLPLDPRGRMSYWATFCC